MKTYKVTYHAIGKKVPYLAMQTDSDLVAGDYAALEDDLVFQLALKGKAPVKIDRALKCSVHLNETQIALKCRAVFIGRNKAMKLYKSQLIREVQNLPDKLTTEQIHDIFDMKDVPTNC